MAVLSHEGTYPIMYGPHPIPVGAAHANGYLARPDEAGKVPVVFVVPDLDGMGSVEKDLCRRLAREGFAALTIDLYGAEGDGLDLYSSMTDDRALNILDEMRQFIVSEDVSWNLADDVGILALDIGGRFGLIKAATRDWVRSLILGYAPLTGDEDREHQVAEYLDHLPVPVLGTMELRDLNIDDRLALIQSMLETRTTAEWLGVLEPAGVPCAPVLHRSEVVEHPQTIANGILMETDHPVAGRLRQTRAPARFEGTPVEYRFGAPVLGEHTDEVLREAGFDEGEIGTLRKAGIVGS